MRQRLKECRITQCEQYSRRYNLEIDGVPGASGEVFEIVKNKISTLLNEDLTRDDTEICHSLPLAGNPNASNIVVQFAHVATRNAVLVKGREKKNKL